MKKLLFVALLAGCSAPMTNPNVSQVQADMDAQDCRYEAELATAGLYDAIARSVRMGELMQVCLARRGYR